MFTSLEVEPTEFDQYYMRPKNFAQNLTLFMPFFDKQTAPGDGLSRQKVLILPQVSVLCHILSCCII